MASWMGFSQPYLQLAGVLFGIAGMQYLTRRSNLLQKGWVLLASVVFMLFFGCRGFVQTDCMNYYPLFLDAPTFADAWFSSLFNSRMEPGFMLLVIACKSIGLDYFGFVAVSAAIDLWLLHKLFQRYLPRHTYAFFLLLYLGFFGLVLEFNLMRNVKSILLFAISLSYVSQGRLSRYLLCNIIGLMFHWSAIIYLPLYFLLRRRIPSSRYMTIYVFSLLLYVISPLIVHYAVQLVSLLGGSIGERADIYLHSSNVDYSQLRIFSIKEVEKILLGWLFIKQYNYIKEQEPDSWMWMNVFLCYFFFSMLGHGMAILIDRVGNLFVPACWILSLFVIRHANKQVAYLLLLYFMLSIPGKLFLTSYKDQFMQYDNWYLDEKIIPFEQREKYYYTVYDTI